MTKIKVVPKKERIEVYKKAIAIIEKGEPVFKLGIDTETKKPIFLLCLILPCIYWNLSDYIDDGKNGEVWSHYSTETMFPEINQDVIREISHIYIQEEQDKKRIEFLESFINQLTN